jgi:hypothetical protein
MTRAQQAGLRVEDLARPALRTLVRRHKLDAQIRRDKKRLAEIEARLAAMKVEE